MVNPISQLPVISADNTIVSIVPITLQLSVFAMCLL